jgi:hypothetical protein
VQRLGLVGAQVDQLPGVEIGDRFGEGRLLDQPVDVRAQQDRAFGRGLVQAPRAAERLAAGELLADEELARVDAGRDLRVA